MRLLYVDIDTLRADHLGCYGYHRNTSPSIDAIAQEQVWFDGAADNTPPGDCPLPATDADVDTRAYRDGLPPLCRKQYETYENSTLHVSSEHYLRQLAVAKAAGKVVLTVDYALQPENVARVYAASRALGYVRPGERLFIVKGINDWRKHQPGAKKRH